MSHVRTPAEIEHSAVSKFVRHIMPFLGLMYLIAYIDRQNIGFAKLQMLGQLGLSETVYGLGASLFFVGYFLFEVPSNLFLAKVGARHWFARIMVSWGAVTILLGFANGPTMFYMLRFMLGVCEAGFFPGVIYLLTIWVPSGHRARMVGWFMIGSAAANAIGAPICGTLLDFDGALGLQGWQWVFLSTGVPAVVVGIATLFILPNSPAEARFFTQEEKDWIQDTIAAEDVRGGKVAHGNPLTVLKDGRVLLLAVTYIGFPLAGYGLSYWLPTVVKGFGVSDSLNGLINILPWIVTALALWWLPRHSERTGEQTMHIFVPVVIGAVCLVSSVVVPGNIPKFALLCIAAACILSPQPVFWTIPSTFLRGTSAAAGLAVINSVGNLGGFLAQNLVPRVQDLTGSTLAPLLLLAGCLLLAGMMVLIVQAQLRCKSAATSTASAVGRTRH